MPVSKKYLDQFRVKNLTDLTVTLGDLVNLEVPPRQIVDLLKVPRIDKEKINQSFDLQEAIRQKRLKIIIDTCHTKKRSKSERQATIADEDHSLCDLTDVATSVANAKDNDLLQFDGNLGKWVAVPPEDIEGADVNVITVTDDYTATCADDLILVDADLTNITITMPPLADCPGKKIMVKKIDDSNHVVTVDGYSTETIDCLEEQELTVQGDCPQMVADSDLTGWYIV